VPQYGSEAGRKVESRLESREQEIRRSGARFSLIETLLIFWPLVHALVAPFMELRGVHVCGTGSAESLALHRLEIVQQEIRRSGARFSLIETLLIFWPLVHALVAPFMECEPFTCAAPARLKASPSIDWRSFNRRSGDQEPGSR
jgi:hypothetical protein